MIGQQTHRGTKMIKKGKNVMELKVGMKNTITINVTAEMCADHLDSQLPQVDLPHVFSTPSMINLMELTCADLLARNLEEGKGSVGLTCLMSSPPPA